MGKIAFVFPGQGAQAVGMGKDVYDAVPASRAAYDRADEVLGFRLTDLVFAGPEDQLKLTYHTQPALLATSIAYLEAFRTAHPDVKPDYAAGHSLGEYSALVAAGALSFEDAVKLVRARGEYMDGAVPAGLGAMAAVLGAEREALEQLCREASAQAGAVELANVNCPGQIVVSGSREGVQYVVDNGKSAGAKRVIPLEVSGPFHSSMMKPAADKLAAKLAETELRAPSVPVVANVTARAETNPDAIRELLVRQVSAPVLWEDSVRWMIGQGVDTFVEIGSGTVLAGLIKKTDKSVRVFSLNSLAAIKNFSLQGGE